MKIQLLSDLHLESQPQFLPGQAPLPAPGADLLVLAGDIGSYQSGSKLSDTDFGLAPFSQFTGLPTGGAAPLDGGGLTPLAQFSSLGAGSALNFDFSGIGDAGFPIGEGMVGGMIAGGASPVTTAANAAGTAAGGFAGAGFGRNWVMPAAGIVSGIGGILTTLGPFFGPFGLAAAAGGSVMSGVSGAILHSFQTVAQRILTNADTILTEKIKNLETTIKQLDAQQTVLSKLVKESLDGDKKALDNL